MNADFLLYHIALLSIMILLTQSLNLTWRADLFSLGHHGYFAIGSYTGVVIIRLTFPALDSLAPLTWDARLKGLTVLVGSLLLAGLLTGAVGYITARLFARLREDYFAIACLILAEIVRSVLSNWDYVGGGIGFEAPYLVIGHVGQEQILYNSFYAAIAIALNTVFYVGTRRLYGSVYGLYITACKDNELAAELSGIDAKAVKRTVFTITTATAGMAGVLFLNFNAGINPKDISFINSIPILLYVILGNLRINGCIIAAVCLYSIYELIKLRFFGIFGDSFGHLLAERKESVLGIILMLSILAPALIEYSRKNLFRPTRGER